MERCSKTTNHKGNGNPSKMDAAPPTLGWLLQQREETRGQARGETGTRAQRRSGRKMVQLLRKTAWQSLKKFRTE